MSQTTAINKRTSVPTQSSLDRTVYTVKILMDNKVDTVIVFQGSSQTTPNKSNGTKTIVSKQSIHPDDTIATIKMKIWLELSGENQPSLEELYLFCQKEESLNSTAVYQALTQHGKIALTKIRLEQFLRNVVSDSNGNSLPHPANQEVYTYDDLFAMKLENQPYIVNKVLGQKFFIVENEYPFVCNPYLVTEYDKFLEQNARKSLSTLNNQLLLNSGEIVDNTIFVCLARSVLTYIDQKEVSPETTLKVYYPFLYNKNINSLPDLERNSEKLVNHARQIVNDKVVDSFKTIDLFYDVYHLRKSELQYVNKGIKYIKAVMKPDFDVKIPLEVIFKTLHATAESPLIKYSPSSRQENVYRLYADTLATDGRKIPYLKKGTIFRLVKTIGRGKSVSVYIETKQGEILNCEFDEEGYITMSGEFRDLVDVSRIDTLFQQAINPVIQDIKTTLEQSGYKLNLFHTLQDEHIDIKQMTYESQIRIQKPFNIEAYKSCLYSVFINETDRLKKNKIVLRFKRVSNFVKLTSQEAFILEKASQGLRGSEIIQALLENYPDDLTMEQARELVASVANELEVERGVRKSDIKIKENPGFKTDIVLDLETGVLHITTENINHLRYLYTLPIYIDTMVRITQNKQSTKYPLADINSLCSGEEYVEVVFSDITPTSEASLEDIEGDESVDYREDRPKGAFDLFFNDDDDDEASYDSLEGGKPSDESLSSFESDNMDFNLPTVPVSKKSSPPSDESLSSFGSDAEPMVLNVPTVPVSKKSSPPSDESLSSFGLDAEPMVLNVPTVQVPNNQSPPSMKSLAPNLTNPLEPSNTVKSRDSELILTKVSPNAEEPIPVLTPRTATNIKEDNENNEEEHDDDNEEEDAENNEEEDDDDDTGDEEDNVGEDQVRNIDGMKLNKPYYFQKMIQKKDPVLILKEDTATFNGYARTCSSNERRQPVILTDAELEKVKKEHPGFLREEDVIKYGSDEKHQFNYICPRYWCLKSNTIVDPKDIVTVGNEKVHKPKNGPSCGKVLPRNAKKVMPGYYIYEFKKEKQYPGLTVDKHPDGYCLPCCFKLHKTKERVDAKKYCLNPDANPKPASKKKAVKEDSYILGPEKFPLDAGRWGYLPGEIQSILHEINADCQVSKTNTNIKDDHPCLLRHGIEVSKHQSFIAAIADAVFYARRVLDQQNKATTKNVEVPSIREMCEHIIKSITLDSFIKYQNGNLVANFHNPYKKVTIEKYKSSTLYSKLNMEKQEDRDYFMKIVSAFESFQLFLRDDEAVIDHTYLWDIVCMPNPNLFPDGINLVIFRLPHDDITNNVEILCPTNHYSAEIYQTRKPTLMLIKEDRYYEPIYSYLTSGKNISITKIFKDDQTLSKTMRSVLNKLIKPFFELICRPQESMPTVYKAKRPLMLYNLIQKLNEVHYTIRKLVMNFNNKIIGVIAQEPEPRQHNVGFVPCYPSSIDDSIKQSIDYVLMNDDDLWTTYDKTVEFLNKLDKRSGKRRTEPSIPCKPAFKIIEDELIVGILTNTNQFIQLSEPIHEQNINPSLDLPSITDDNYIVNTKTKPMLQSEVLIATQKDVDVEREDYIKKIKLETSFYNVFRNTIRILINNYEHIKLREQIEQEIKKQYILYNEKLNNVNTLLQKLVGKKIQFIGDKNYYKLIGEVSTCIVKDGTQCANASNLCMATNDGECNLILPERNLITGKENKRIYFGRMADELIRYNRIKSFMFQPQTYLSFSKLGYNLRDNEIILIQSSLTQEYFDNLTPAVTNKYTKFNSYDEAQPVISQVYENTVKSADQQPKLSNCEITEHKHIVSTHWRKCFPSNYKESEYAKEIACTFQFIIDIIERKTQQEYSINDIKRQLYDEYKQYLDKYSSQIVDILIEEGKKELGSQVRNGSLEFDALIYTNDYFLTTLDLWMLVVRHKIPTVFISQKYLLETAFEKHEFCGYGSRDDSFVFITIPGLRAENIPRFKVIKSNQDDLFISLDNITEEFTLIIESTIREKLTIEEFLSKFNLPKKTVYTKKKPKTLIDNEELKTTKKPNMIIENAHELDVEPTKKNTVSKAPIKKSKMRIEGPLPDEI